MSALFVPQKAEFRLSATGKVSVFNKFVNILQKSKAFLRALTIISKSFRKSEETLQATI
jgi:hypothetical protein